MNKPGLSLLTKYEGDLLCKIALLIEYFHLLFKINYKSNLFDLFQLINCYHCKDSQIYIILQNYKTTVNCKSPPVSAICFYPL